jgi:hypothetical protein
MRPHAALLALAFAAQAACGAAQPPGPTTSERAIEAQRVAQVLERRHPSHAQLDAAVAARAFDQLLRALDPSSGCAPVRSELDADGVRIAAALKRGDFEFAIAAARACTGRTLTPNQAKLLSLDALATAYDAHSHYLDAPALARRRGDANDAPAAARGRLIEHAGQHSAWIELPSFYLSTGRSASSDVRFLARELATRGARALVLDLRGNGGGVVSEAVALAGALLGGGPLAYERDAHGRVRALQAESSSELWAGAVVVLIDARTASMAELFAGALQDRGRALLIGERSYGKGFGQTLVLLSSPVGGVLGAVDVTERVFYRLDGTSLHGFGVTPDVALASRPEQKAVFSSWCPARIEPTEAGALQRLDPKRVDRARAAIDGSASSELDRILAATAAYTADALASKQR